MSMDIDSDIIEVAVEMHRAVRTDKFICPNAALADISKSVLSGRYDFKVDYKGYHVDETISIYSGEPASAYKWKEYSDIDRITHDALVSHYIAGSRVFSLDMLWRTMTGSKDSIPSECKELVENSLLKLMGTIVIINGTYQGQKIKFKDNLIHARILTSANINGQIINGAIALLYEPVLYTYSQSRNHVLSYPVDLLSAGGNTSARTTIIKHFLFKRIEQIKSAKSDISDSIAYESIYRVAKATTKKEKQNTRNQVRKLLDDLIHLDYISDYKVISKGCRCYHSIQIIYKGTPPKLVPDPRQTGTCPP